MKLSRKVAVIGGGVAGSTVSLFLAQQGIDVTLIEKGDSLVNGPPFCHLHAGGNLYREISLDQCESLLKQSIEFVKFYPYVVNARPTVIAVPVSDNGDPAALERRLTHLAAFYQNLVDDDPSNAVLGKPVHYFKSYSKDDLRRLSKLSQPCDLTDLEHWLIPFSQQVDLERLKYPVYAVQEFGLSLFRVAASIQLRSAALPNLDVKLNSEIKELHPNRNGWDVQLGDNASEFYDFVINACGFETGVIDDMLDCKEERLVEFKAAYVTQWSEKNGKWPEVIFHGERGTPNGMAQLTPYADGMFQLHGMTKEITLFRDGLAATKNGSAQPQLPNYLINKINHGWQATIIEERGRKAIEHVAQFLPNFKTATVAGKPLFGAQQIPGRNATLRSADVSFGHANYARVEIVKASSSLEAAKKIYHKWFTTQRINLPGDSDKRKPIRKTDIESRARSIAKQRQYPESLAKAY
jgi:hypothetical protein